MSKDKVQIIEVGPRDGLQNESKALDIDTKVKFIEMLISSGLTNIEITSFVNPKKIPQMQDASGLYGKVLKIPGFLPAQSPCLVPNIQGLDNALEAEVKSIAIFTASSNEFNKKNINATIEESFVRLTEVSKKALSEGLKIRGYISTSFGCPYEGHVDPTAVLEIAKRLQDLGCYEISLGDTIGIANPLQVKELIHLLSSDFDKDFFAMHFHDTRGTALVNIFSSYQEGIRKFDSSAGSLGGCPYAVGSIGNVATEDVVNMFESMGIVTEVDLDKLMAATDYIFKKLNKACPSKYFNACFK